MGASITPGDDGVGGEDHEISGAPAKPGSSPCTQRSKHATSSDVLTALREARSHQRQFWRAQTAPLTFQLTDLTVSGAANPWLERRNRSLRTGDHVSGSGGIVLRGNVAPMLPQLQRTRSSRFTRVKRGKSTTGEQAGTGASSPPVVVGRTERDLNI